MLLLTLLAFGLVPSSIAVAVAVAVPTPAPFTSTFHTVDLQRHHGKLGPVAKALKATRRLQQYLPTALETLDAGFWYGNFSIGASTNLSLLIDTGSDDVAVNPGLYIPSSASQNLGQSGALRYGTTEEDGCGSADIAYNTFADCVSQQGLVAENQTFGDVYATPPPNNGTITQFPHDGLVGFAGVTPNETQLGGRPFFQTLCDQGRVEECRFGLAFGTEGVGKQIFGGVNSSLFAGKLETAAVQKQWLVNGSAIAGKEVISNQRIILDSGTANVSRLPCSCTPTNSHSINICVLTSPRIVGPPSVVRTLFDSLGLESYEQNLSGCTSVLFGYYPCDAPPTVGFQFGTGANSTAVYNIEASAFQQADNGNNNCTATVTGITFGSSGDLWIVGQTWFQGKYVDFDAAGKMIGVAQLRDKAGAS